MWTGFTLLAAAAMLGCGRCIACSTSSLFDLRNTVIRDGADDRDLPGGQLPARPRPTRGDGRRLTRRVSCSHAARDASAQKLLTRRAALLAGGQVALVATLAGRLYQLQVLERDRYRVLADENRINLRLLAPPRGRILDRFGVALADNRQNYRVVIVPEQTGDIDATLDAIATLIEVSDADRHRVLRDAKRKHAFVPVVVRSNLSWDEMARIEVAIPELARRRRSSRA